VYPGTPYAFKDISITYKKKKKKKVLSSKVPNKLLNLEVIMDGQPQLCVDYILKHKLCSSGFQINTMCSKSSILTN